MKNDQKMTRRKPKLILTKESLRKLADPDLFNVAGGGGTNQCDTITFKCCLTR